MLLSIQFIIHEYFPLSSSSLNSFLSCSLCQLTLWHSDMLLQWIGWAEGFMLCFAVNDRNGFETLHQYVSHHFSFLFLKTNSSDTVTTYYDSEKTNWHLFLLLAQEVKPFFPFTFFQQKFYPSLHVVNLCILPGELKERTVTKEEGQKLADHYRCRYIETSAVSGDNVEQSFKMIAEEVLRHRALKASDKVLEEWKTGWVRMRKTGKQWKKR